MKRRWLAWKGGVDGLDSKLYLFILDSRQLEAAVGSNELFISCHVLGSVDAMLRFIHAVGLLKLAVFVPVHACTQQITLVFVCGTCVPTLAYLWYLVKKSPLSLMLLRTEHLLRKLGSDNCYLDPTAYSP